MRRLSELHPVISTVREGICSLSSMVAVLLLIWAPTTAVSAELAADTIAPIVPCAEFRIGKDGRLLILPVQVEGQEVLCLVDTGASASGFDLCLEDHLGAPRANRVIRTPAGLRAVETFDWPQATLGGHSLKSDRPILCIDLENVRQATGKDVRGFIGMDVLRSCRIQIDFDRGLMRFLETLPKDRPALGTVAAITFREDGTPWITAYVKPEDQERFLIDTGTHGNSLRAALFDEYVEEGLISAGTPSTSETLAGTVTGEAGRIKRLSVGPFRLDGLRVASTDLNSVGLRYLSRFQVVFDFPGKAVYLQKGAGYRKPEPQATSGMALAWIDGHIVVTSVLAKGPAEATGLRTDDVILRVDGKDAVEYDQFSLRTFLTSQVGRNVLLTIRRGVREIDAELVLVEK